VLFDAIESVPSASATPASRYLVTGAIPAPSLRLETGLCETVTEGPASR